MSPDWRRLWVAGLQTIPSAAGALALTWLSDRWAAGHGSSALAIAAGLFSLIALAALLGMDLRSPWGDAVLIAFGLLIGVVLGTLDAAHRGGEGMAIGVGIGLTLGAGITGCTLNLRHVRPLIPWLVGLAWLYLLGWIPVLTVVSLRSYSNAWAAFGLGVFLVLTAIWTASIQTQNALKTPARTSLQLYLLVLNVILAVTIILRPGE